jgi:putative toxin-antitoxin system antitoxin component (TIGR02293 family)
VLNRGATSSEAFSLIIARRTYDHRRQRRQPFSLDQAERAVTLVNMLVMAERVFGDLEKAQRWLRSANPHFDGASRIALLRSMLGARELEEELIRIDEGYFA